MKAFFLVTLGFIFSATCALASPTVGDYSKFETKTVAAGKTRIEFQEIELISYDADSKKFTALTTITDESGNSKSEKEELDESSLLSDSMVASILEGCEKLGGIKEGRRVKDVDYQTCKITQSPTSDETNITWFAAVPFGFVNYVSIKKSADEVTDMQLMDFRRGQ